MVKRSNGGISGRHAQGARIPHARAALQAEEMRRQLEAARLEADRANAKAAKDKAEKDKQAQLPPHPSSTFDSISDDSLGYQ